MTDLQIIKQIEQELNIKLKEINKIDSYIKGYTLNKQAEIMGLGLYNCKINNLNRIIGYPRKVGLLIITKLQGTLKVPCNCPTLRG